MNVLGVAVALKLSKDIIACFENNPVMAAFGVASVSSAHVAGEVGSSPLEVKQPSESTVATSGVVQKHLVDEQWPAWGALEVSEFAFVACICLLPC